MIVVGKEDMATAPHPYFLFQLPHQVMQLDRLVQQSQRDTQTWSLVVLPLH